MPKFPNWTTGMDVSGTNLANDVPNIVNKAAVTTITSNTTLTNDAELQNIAIGVGTWEIEFELWVTGITAGNFKTDWSFTGTLTGTPQRACFGPSSASVAAPNALTSLQAQVVAYNVANVYGINSTTIPAIITEKCPNLVCSVAGNLAIRVAQNALSATSTVIAIGSKAKVRQIG